nr:UPF0236 family protein [Caldibacillus debilis]
MNKDITEFPNLKQIEQILWNKLQEIFSKALKSLLEDMDQQIAEERDKKRFRLSISESSRSPASLMRLR